jgi:hypothetical protein
MIACAKDGLWVQKVGLVRSCKFKKKKAFKQDVLFSSSIALDLQPKQGAEIRDIESKP